MSAGDGLIGAGATELAVKCEGHHVILRFPRPVAWVLLEPEVAYHAGEAIARAAHEARHGTVPDDATYIASQVRARVTEDLRNLLVARVALMLPSLRQNNQTDGYVAMQVVDTVLAQIA